MSLTYDKLVQLAEGLRVDISELFTGGGDSGGSHPTGRRSVNRLDDGVVVQTQHYDHTYLSTEVANKRIVPLLVECRAHSIQDFSGLVKHQGEEFVFVLQGTLEVHTEFYNPTVLAAGESMWLDSSMGHAYVAVGDEPCRVLAICSIEESQLMAAMEQLQNTTAKKPVRSARKKRDT